MLDALLHAFRHDTWANRAVLNALSGAKDPPTPAVAAFQHILETEHVWFGRLLQDGAPMIQLWDTPSLTRCITWAVEVEQKKHLYLAHLTEEALAEPFSYRNSAGQEFTGMPADILLHTLLHSSQYRGEATGFAVAAGISVPDVDFIYWMRLGEPGPA